MEYKYEQIKKHVESSINETGRDGWRVVAFSEDVIFGSGCRWDVIYKREDDWATTGEMVEYKLVTAEGKIIPNIEKYTRFGWRLVSFSNNTTFGSSGNYDLIFERTIVVK